MTDKEARALLQVVKAKYARFYDKIIDKTVDEAQARAAHAVLNKRLSAKIDEIMRAYMKTMVTSAYVTGGDAANTVLAQRGLVTKKELLSYLDDYLALPDEELEDLNRTLQTYRVKVAEKVALGFQHKESVLNQIFSLKKGYENAERMMKNITDSIADSQRAGESRAKRLREIEDKFRREIGIPRKSGRYFFRDRGSKTWSFDAYTRMLDRTIHTSVYNKAQAKQFIDVGVDLVRVSTNPGTEDECVNYEGMIVSLTGATPGFITLAELESSQHHIFHPNCRHTIQYDNTLMAIQIAAQKRG